MINVDMSRRLNSLVPPSSSLPCLLAVLPTQLRTVKRLQLRIVRAVRRLHRKQGAQEHLPGRLVLRYRRRVLLQDGTGAHMRLTRGAN